MRLHDHDADESFGSEATRSRGVQGEVPGLQQALAAGRPDALGATGLLHLQRMAGNSAVGSVLDDEERSPVHEVVNSGGGQPLDGDTRTDMEARLGHDFSDVRVHTDGAAHESAKAVNAHAYTVGNNVVFQRDTYDPASEQGRKMLAHELTHVVQQRSGPVDGTPAPGGINVSDPSDRFEREAVANADHVMSQPTPAAEAVSPTGPAVQRQDAPAEEEEEPVQTFVQRQDAPAEEEEETPPAS